MRQGSIAVITALSHESRDTFEFPLTEGIFLIVCCVPGHLNFQYLVGKVFCSNMSFFYLALDSRLVSSLVGVLAMPFVLAGQFWPGLSLPGLVIISFFSYV